MSARITRNPAEIRTWYLRVQVYSVTATSNLQQRKVKQSKIPVLTKHHAMKTYLLLN